MGQAREGLEVEQALIGAALDGQAVLRLVEASDLHESHRVLWRVLQHLEARRERIDEGTVTRELLQLDRRARFAATRQFGCAYVIRCTIAWHDIPHVARDVAPLIEIVLQQAARRREERALLQRLGELRTGRRAPTAGIVPYRRRPRG